MKLAFEGIVINHNDSGHVAVEHGEVLDVLPVDVPRGLPVQMVHDAAVFIKRRDDRFGDALHRGGEEDDFVVLAQLPEEFVDSWPAGVVWLWCGCGCGCGCGVVVVLDLAQQQQRNFLYVLNILNLGSPLGMPPTVTLRPTAINQRTL